MEQGRVRVRTRCVLTRDYARTSIKSETLGYWLFTSLQT